MKRLLFLPFILSMAVVPVVATAQKIHAIVHDYVDEVNCINSQRLQWTQTYTIELLDQKAESLAEFSISCDDTRKLSKFSMTVADATGKVVRKIKKSELKATEYSPDMVTDGRMYYYEYQPTSYPVTITVSTEVEENGGIVIFPSFNPVPAYATEVRHAAYRLSTPADVEVQYRLQAINTPVKTSQTADGRILTEIELTSVAPIKSEPLSPPATEILPMAWFSPKKFSLYKTSGSMMSWKEFGAWQYGLIKDRDALPDNFKEQLRSMTASCQNDREKVETIYQLLRKTTRYNSIQLGIGGWQPATAESVNRTGMGDCKALTNYMRSMLEAVGIESVYTTIHTKREKIHEDFVSLNQFNHVILQVPLSSDTLWLECTNPMLPMGYLHDGIAGHDCLLITPDGGKLAHVPAYNDEQNATTLHANIDIAADGTADIDATIDFAGTEYEDAFYWQFLEKDKMKERLHHMWNISQLSFDEIEWSDISSEKAVPTVRVTAKAHSNVFGKKAGTRLFIPINPFAASMKNAVQQEARVNDVSIRQSFVDSYDIRITLPEGFILEARPADSQQQYKPDGATVAGCHTLKLEQLPQQEGNTRTTIAIGNTLSLSSGKWDKATYPQLKEWIQATEKALRQQIVIKK